MSPQYQAAIKAHNDAIHAFHPFQDKFRRGEISADEFIAAQKVYDKATKAFDIAYAEEEKREESGPVCVPIEPFREDYLRFN